jgi:pimeloyl-ACP methyl ester carboxylesterase
MTTVLLPGIGSDGPETWPTQAGDATLECPSEPLFVTLSRKPGHGAARHAEDLLAATSGPLDVVAHSYGAIAALIAARDSDRVRSLALFEPACMSVAPDAPSVKAFVEALAPVFARATDPAVPDGDIAGPFLVAFGYEYPPPGDVGAAEFGRRLRDATPAWEVALDPTVCAHIPTLVVTGSWHPIYEDIAAALERAGARRDSIPGTEHRPQDDPRANALLNAFWRGLA